MTMLIIPRGLPGSGKSTRARAWVAESPDTRAEVNRDAIRLMLCGYTVGTPAQEKMVTRVSHNSIRDLLKSGVDVVCSDTNLASKYVRELMQIAIAQGASVVIWDMTDVDLHTCLERNRYRTDKAPVPDTVIRRMHARYIQGREYPLPVPDMDSAGQAPDLYVPPIGGIPADICDIDGTVADHRGVRSPYDYALVSKDRARRAVIDVLHSRRASHKLIFVSGRPDVKDVRRDTEAWLRSHVRLPYEALYMRPADQLQVSDTVIKRDIFDRYIRHEYDIGVVFDDRDKVVRMWREDLGLDCFQVNYGDF